MPPLPNALFKKYTTEFSLSDYDALNLTESKDIALFFEEIIKETNNYKAAANWVMGSVKSYLNQNAIEINEFPLSAIKLVEIIKLVDEKLILNSTAEQRLFPALLANPNRTAQQLAEENDWLIKNDLDELEEIVKRILNNHPTEFERLKNGEKKLIGFFLGQIMKASKGAANPKTVTQVINKLI